MGLAIIGTCAVTEAADDPKRPKDAAEAVQEGNVQNWIEYYQRTRPPPPQRPTDPVAAPTETKPGESAEPIKR